MRSMLLNSTGYAGVMMSSGGMGGGGAGGGGGGQEGPGDSTDDFGDELLDIDLNDDTGPLLEGATREFNGFDDFGNEGNEINVDDPEFLDKLFKEDQTNNSNNADLDEAGDSQEQQKALAKAMTDSIAAIGIPENAIPENFDPSDPKQFRDVVGAIQRQTAQETIKIMWQPVAAAMTQTIVRMRQEMSETMKNGISNNDLDSQIMKAIPSYKNPAFKAAIDVVRKQAERRFPGDNARIVAATRKGVQAMGIKLGTGGSSSSTGRPKTAAERTNAMLDMFAKLPTQSTTPNQRLGNRLQQTKK